MIKCVRAKIRALLFSSYCTLSVLGYGLRFTATGNKPVSFRTSFSLATSGARYLLKSRFRILEFGILNFRILEFHREF